MSATSGFVVLLSWCVGVATSTATRGAAPIPPGASIDLGPSALTRSATVGAEASAAAPAVAPSPSPSSKPSPSPSASGRGVLSRLLPEGLTLTTYAEVSFTWDTTQPTDGVINLRGFDARHSSFSITNVVVDLGWDLHNVVGRLALQAGLTGETYYLGERAPLPGGRESRDVWRHVQQAWIGYRLPVLSGLNVNAGLFLSPIGPEGMAVREQWTWSRSNLFFGLPFYHVGARAELALDPRWTATLGLLNGWNAAIDGDADKSVLLRLSYADDLGRSFSALYLVGTEGLQRRHLFDGYGTFPVVDRLWVQAHLDGGFVEGSPRTWFGGALALRLTVVEPGALDLAGIWLALRGDALHEGALTAAAGDSFFFGASWVSSLTGTLEVRPADGLSVRLEGRYDGAASPIFGPCALDAGRCTQDRATITLGATAWL